MEGGAIYKNKWQFLETSGCHNWGSPKETRDAVKPSAVHRRAPHNKELSGPKCYSVDIKKSYPGLITSLVQLNKS